jgi:hypothetical protein
LSETSEALLDGLGIGFNVKFVLYQFSRNSRHVSRLTCENVLIFLDEFDEREFLFGIQIISHMSDLGGIIRGEWNGLAELVLQLDGQLVGLGLGHDRVWWDSAKAFFRSWSFVDANNMSDVSQLYRSQS